MSLTIHFFYLGFIGILVCTIMVVESRNSIYSIFFLLATFVFTALFLLGLGVEFLALNLVILYVGAIIILFLLIVMLVNQRTNNLEVKRTPVVGVISYMFLYFSLKMVYNWNLLLFRQNDASVWTQQYIQDPRLQLGVSINYYQDLNIFGFHLYISNFFLLLLCGILLLVAMICSLILILRVQNKYKDVFT